MRQIYNTAESPEMAIFQLLDMMPSAGGGEATPTPVNPQPKVQSAHGQSSCKNTSRLSLANLLPSRLENDLNFNSIEGVCWLRHLSIDFHEEKNFVLSNSKLCSEKRKIFNKSLVEAFEKLSC